MHRACGLCFASVYLSRSSSTKSRNCWARRVGSSTRSRRPWPCRTKEDIQYYSSTTIVQTSRSRSPVRIVLSRIIVLPAECTRTSQGRSIFKELGMSEVGLRSLPRVANALFPKPVIGQLSGGCDLVGRGDDRPDPKSRSIPRFLRGRKGQWRHG